MLKPSGRGPALHHEDPGQRWLRRAPLIVALSVAGFLAAALLMVVAIDLLDVLGLRQRLFVERASEYPWAFYHLFSEAHPVEWLQWLLLILAGSAAVFSAGRLHVTGTPRKAWGVALMGFSFGVLAVKDAGNPRHIAAWMVEGILGSTAAKLVELAVFGSVALLAVAGLLTAWPELRRRRGPAKLFLAGYVTYALAAVMSATSDLWYERAGSWVLEGLFAGRALEAPAGWEPGLRSWLFMDSVAEESLELVAAGLLAVAALALLREAQRYGTPSGAGSPGEGQVRRQPRRG